MSAVYAFSRRVDDIGDGSLDDTTKLAALAAERERVELLGESKIDSDDPVMIALADAQPPLRAPARRARSLIDGVELDVRGTSYETFDELVVYCRHVAGSIGRLCLAIFGAGDREPAIAGRRPRCRDAADQHPSRRARGLRERPRVPAGRRTCGASGSRIRPPRRPQAGRPDPLRGGARPRVVRSRARLVEVLDSRSGSCVLAMTGIYRRHPGADRAPARRGAPAADLGAGVGEGVAGGAQPGGGAGGSVAVERRRRRPSGGMAVAWRSSAAGSPGSPRRSTAPVAARRSRCSSPALGSAAPPTRCSATGFKSTTASTYSCAAARPTASCSHAWGRSTASPSSRGCRSPCSRPASPTVWLRRAACPRPCISRDR